MSDARGLAMAIVLAAEVIELADERRCVNALLAAHFDCEDVLECLRVAQEFAREMRATSAEAITASEAQL